VRAQYAPDTFDVLVRQGAWPRSESRDGLGPIDEDVSHAAIASQRRADVTEGAELDHLVAVIARDGGGRTYAGMPSNWGQDFTVGAVPVFKYLESRDVDEVGYTLRTASLMTDPEYYFEERNPGD
jgi:hypothetical protein